MKRWYLILTLCVSSLLGACGFHLQGKEAAATRLGKIYITGDAVNGVIFRTVKIEILNSGVEVVDHRREADHILWIGRERSELRSASYDFLLRTAENVFIIETRFEVRDGGGELIFGPAAVFAERVYEYDVQGVTSSAAQRDLIEKELRENLGYQIARRIASIDPSFITTSDGRRIPRKTDEESGPVEPAAP